eukprot:scaffold134376_cov45-Attheya_sp.AAC.2
MFRGGCCFIFPVLDIYDEGKSILCENIEFVLIKGCDSSEEGFFCCCACSSTVSSLALIPGEAISSEEELVPADNDRNIEENSLSTLFHTLDPNTLSCNEIFVALEYKALLTLWEKKKKMWKALKEAFNLQEKTKAIIILGRPDLSLLTKAKELEELVKWKVGKDATKGKKKPELLQL